jgi:amino acid efflux transporter
MTKTTAPPLLASLSVPRGTALYIGALLGPGVLLLPGLASSMAGPAAILAWAGLLGVSALFAVVFTALGSRFPGEGGVGAYTRAGLGGRAGSAAGWCFLLGVVAGAPVVCLIGGGYVASLTGGGQMATTAAAAGLLLLVLALALGGTKTSTGVQMVLVAVLLAVVILGVAGSAHAAHARNWAPFAPHGWAAIGHAASVIMLSFIGWEAVAPLTARFANPRRQLPRVVTIAFVTTAVLYLSLAAATTAVLGRSAASNVPLVGLLQIAVGPAGRGIAAGAAVLLTLGATNAYLSGAAVMARGLTGRNAGTGTSAPAGRPPKALYLAIAAAGLLIIGLDSAHLLTTAQLVTIPTALFITVYLGCTASAVRVLRGWSRAAAWPALAAVIVVLAFSGWSAVLALVIAAAAGCLSGRRPARTPLAQDRTFPVCEIPGREMLSHETPAAAVPLPDRDRVLVT